MSAPLAPLVAASDRLAGTAGRNDKVAIIAQALRAARDRSPPLPQHEASRDVALTATYLAGKVPQDRLEVGWATVRGLDVPPAAAPTLLLADVDAALEDLAGASGSGSRTARLAVLTGLFAAATAAEQTFLSLLILGELRQGALEGVVVKGIAVAAGLPEAVVRRALMLSADLGTVAAVALHEGREALEAIGLQVGRGVQPMLAATAPSVAAALQEMGPAVVEWKLDGIRVQIHRRGDDVRVLTRNLNDVTARAERAVEIVRSLRARSVILDGELLSVGEEGRPVPFQDTVSAFSNTRAEVRGLPFFFDVLHLDGDDLIDLPLATRRTRLHELVAEEHRIPSVIVSDPDAAEAVLAEALAQGHEGVMVKDLA
ncbi:MAG TPA: hypothetical protein VMM13_16310, partial [Euzebya sp.]|nr:hypothetical protein [Euzebya sp.]